MGKSCHAILILQPQNDCHHTCPHSKVNSKYHTHTAPAPFFSFILLSYEYTAWWNTAFNNEVYTSYCKLDSGEKVLQDIQEELDKRFTVKAKLPHAIPYQETVLPNEYDPRHKVYTNSSQLWAKESLQQANTAK